MTTETRSLRPIARRRFHRLALLAGAGVLAGAAGVTVGRAVAARPTDQVVDVEASYVSIPSLGALTRQAALVVAGRVVGEGTTHLVPQPTPRPQPFQPAPPSGAPQEKLEMPRYAPAHSSIGFVAVCVSTSPKRAELRRHGAPIGPDPRRNAAKGV